MTRRILQSTLLVVTLTAVLLGLPLLWTAWQLVSDLTRTELAGRLDQIAVAVQDQEDESGRIRGDFDESAIRFAIPAGGRLTVTYFDSSGLPRTAIVGAGIVGKPLTEDRELGPGGSLRLEVPGEPVRATQLQVSGVILVMIGLSVAAGAAVSAGTARRLALPLRDVATRAARLGAGDFRPAPARHQIAELDEVSDVLDAVATEVAAMLQRERDLVGDVSHQLRSRLTAVRLRLDELAAHDDAAVVTESAAAMAQVDRLAAGIDDLIRASRQRRSPAAAELDVMAAVVSVVAEWRPRFAGAGRDIAVAGPARVRAHATAARLREALAVLVDNSLAHGDGLCTVRVRTLAAPGEGPDGEATEGGLVCVEVSDTGGGVADELVPHVFDRGFSAARSTGVGLALARALIEADGGRLRLQTPSLARFVIYLPVAGGPRVPDAQAEPR